jgi:electron transfer flavoprotein alpha subunit
MSVLVFVEAIKNQYKKAAYEAVCYGAKLAEMTSGDCVVVTNGSGDVAGGLGKYGATKVLSFQSEDMHDSSLVTNVIAKAAEQSGAKHIVLDDNSRGKSIAGRLAIKLDAGVVSGASSLPTADGNLTVERPVFSGKAFATYAFNSDKSIISISRNAVPISESGSPVTAENLDISGITAATQLVEVKRVEGTVPLPEAELVVSAGRGMKGPENWGIIDDLADVLGATTACSRPVSDTGWRPHHEHVGQTGIAIKPNLYIAVGISGAIQHLAGVNSSKTIVVINKDSEAPFFKAADYGVVGDLFDVVPRLTESIKKFKSA